MSFVAPIDNAGELIEERHVVGRHDNSRTLLGNTLEELHDACGRLGIEVACGLIGHDETRAVENGARNSDALLFSARQLVRHFVGLVAHPYKTQHFFYAFPAIGLIFPSCGFQNKRQVFIDSAVAQQLEVLEHNAHLPAKGRHLLALESHHVSVEDYSAVSFIYVQLIIYCIQQRTLSRTYLADDVDKGAVADFEVNISEHASSVNLINIRFFVIYKHNSIFVFLWCKDTKNISYIASFFHFFEKMFRMLYSISKKNAIFAKIIRERNLKRRKSMAKYNITERKEKEATYRTLVSPTLMDELKERILNVIVMQKKYKDKDYSAKRLAEDLGTNTRYISAVVNVKFHMNYTSFVNKYRIEEAMSILVDKRYQNLRIEEVSDMVGFSNRQSFYASFYKIMGITPKEYRMQHSTKLKAKKTK